MKIFLFRHGDKQHVESTNYVIKNAVALSQLGVYQVNSLANYLKNSFPELSNLEYIYSSPIPRAVQTAEIIRQKIGIKEIILNQVLEELYPTKDYSLSKEIRDEMLRAAMIDIDLVPDTQIPFRTLIQNFINFLITKSELGDSSIVVSTHGALIRNTIYYLFPDLKPAPDAILEAKIHTAGLTILNYDGQKFNLEVFDYSAHLE